MCLGFRAWGQEFSFGWISGWCFRVLSKSRDDSKVSVLEVALAPCWIQFFYCCYNKTLIRIKDNHSFIMRITDNPSLIIRIKDDHSFNMAPAGNPSNSAALIDDLSAPFPGPEVENRWVKRFRGLGFLGFRGFRGLGFRGF